MKKNSIKVKSIHPLATRPLRHKVLWPHISLEEDCNIDIDQREDGIHLGSFYEDKIISVASFFKMHSDKIDFSHQYRLRAMATDPDYRKLGSGRELLTSAFEILRKKEADVLWCNAREVALGFYSSLGFEVIDEWYDIPVIGPHKFMYYSLKD